MSTVPFTASTTPLRTYLMPSEAAEHVLRIPSSAMSFEGFLDWKDSDNFPTGGRISWLKGALLIDMNAEDGESHSRLKLALHATLNQVVRQKKLGLLYPDGFSLFNLETRWQTDPDGMFLTWDTYHSQRAKFRSNKQERLSGLYGTPDWVLEVVSDSSAQADREEFKAIYEEIGVREYWVIDGRRQELIAEIYTLVEGRYHAITVTHGMWQSPVFGCTFQFQRSQDEHGFWDDAFDVVATHE